MRSCASHLNCLRLFVFVYKLVNVVLTQIWHNVPMLKVALNRNAGADRLRVCQAGSAVTGVSTYYKQVIGISLRLFVVVKTCS